MRYKKFNGYCDDSKIRNIEDKYNLTIGKIYEVHEDSLDRNEFLFNDYNNKETYEVGSPFDLWFEDVTISELRKLKLERINNGHS